MYYHVCPFCGANLDPGERCDCTEEKRMPPAGVEDPKTADNDYGVLSMAQNRRKSND